MDGEAEYGSRVRFELVLGRLNFIFRGHGLFSRRARSRSAQNEC